MLSWLHETFQSALDENVDTAAHAPTVLEAAQPAQVLEEGTVPELFGAQAHFQALAQISRMVITYYILAKNPGLVAQLIRLLNDSKPFLTHAACPRELRSELTSLILRLEHMKSRHQAR